MSNINKTIGTLVIFALVIASIFILLHKANFSGLFGVHESGYYVEVICVDGYKFVAARTSSASSALNHITQIVGEDGKPIRCE